MQVFILCLLVAVATAQNHSVCQGKGKGFHPDIYDCDWYYYCDGEGGGERHRCPVNQW